MLGCWLFVNRGMMDRECYRRGEVGEGYSW